MSISQKHGEPTSRYRSSEKKKQAPIKDYERGGIRRLPSNRTQWGQDDIVGVIIDCDKNTIEFELNGELVGDVLKIKLIVQFGGYQGEKFRSI